MKKIMQLICLGLIIIIAGCNKDSSKDEVNPLPILAMLSLQGNSSLTVKATYNGTASAGAKIYAYLYNSLGVTSRDPDALYIGSADCTPGVESTIKVENILDGDYYVMVLYDYNHAVGQANVDNQQDCYILYNNTGLPESAAKFTVKGASTLNSVVFGDTYKLQPSSAFQSATGHHNLTFKAVYNGDVGTGDKKIHAYLYSTLPGTTPSSTTPYKTFVSTAAVNPGDETGVVFRNIADSPTVSNYVLVFYDYSTTGTGTTGVQDDRYVFYNGKQYADEATSITINGANQDLGTISFGNSYTLGSGGTFMSDYGTVIVSVDYTVAASGENLHVNLYSSLGADTATPAPSYTWVSDTPLSSTNGTTDVTIPDVHFGNYYMVVYYDADGSNNGNLDDPYRLYNNTSSGAQYVSDAQSFPVSTSTADTDLGSLTLGTSYLLDAGGAYDTPPVFYSLSVPVRYTGTNGTTGDQKIHVSLFSSWGSSSASPLYTGATAGAVSSGADDSVTITGIAPGTYKMLVFYDYNSTASDTTGIQGDRYILYGNSGYTTSGTSDLVISGDTTLSEGERVIFGNLFRLQSSGGYMDSTKGYLTVYATYTGTEPTSTIGTKDIGVYLYSSIGTAANNSTYIAFASTGLGGTGVTISQEYAISLNGVAPGSYYVLVFYDFNSGGPANRYDRYILYNMVHCYGNATTLSVPSFSGYTDWTGVSFGDSWQLGSSSVYNNTSCP